MLAFVYFLTGGALAIAAAAAQAPSADATSPANSGLSRAEAEATARNCGNRRFQSVAEALVDGQKKRATIMLCAKPTDTDAQWIDTLKKSAAQIAASPTISAESKAKLRIEIDAAIANVGGSSLAGVAPLSGPVLGGAGAATGTMPLASNRPTRPAPLAPLDRLESNVPPLPAPLPPKPVGSGPALLASLLAQPQITVRCLESGENGGGAECDEVRINTTLLVRADENFPAPAVLRFVRNGDARADVDLGNMRKGQVRRMKLPSDVCRGVVRSQLELNTVLRDPKTRSEQSGRMLGPISLRC